MPGWTSSCEKSYEGIQGETRSLDGDTDLCITASSVTSNLPSLLKIGVHVGLGAVAVLAALRKNAEEGSEGVLLGFDPNPEAGWLIPERLRDAYVPVVGDVTDTYEAAVAKHGIDLVIHDIGIGFPHDSYLFGATLSHARPSDPPSPVLIRSEVHGHPVLRQFAADRSGEYFEFTEQPLDHFWRGTEIGVALFDRADG